MVIVLETTPDGPLGWIMHQHGQYVAQWLTPFIRALFAIERTDRFHVEIGAFASHYIQCAETFADGNDLLCKFLLLKFRMFFETWGWNQQAALAAIGALLAQHAERLPGTIPDLVPNKEEQVIRGLTVEYFLRKHIRTLAVA